MACRQYALEQRVVFCSKRRARKLASKATKVFNELMLLRGGWLRSCCWYFRMCSDENTSLLARKLSTKVVGINQLNFAVVMQKIPCWKSKSLSTYLFIAYSPFNLWRRMIINLRLSSRKRKKKES